MLQSTIITKGKEESEWPESPSFKQHVLDKRGTDHIDVKHMAFSRGKVVVGSLT